jgi:Siderophore-interacting protein/Siderophore-interacting FAD-binding domain
VIDTELAGEPGAGDRSDVVAVSPENLDPEIGDATVMVVSADEEDVMRAAEAVPTFAALPAAVEGRESVLRRPARPRPAGGGRRSTDATGAGDGDGCSRLHPPPSRRPCRRPRDRRGPAREGVATAWAAEARPGDVLGVVGPRGSRLWKRPPARLALIGDETALPAVSRWVRELPPGSQARVVLQVADKGEQQSLVSQAEVRTTWPPHSTDARPQDVAADVARDPDVLGADLIWAAGDADLVRRTRDALVASGVDAARLERRGYWRRGVTDYQEPHED